MQTSLALVQILNQCTFSSRQWRLLYLQQTINSCQDHYEKLKYLDIQRQKPRNKIKDDGIEFLGRFLNLIRLEKETPVKIQGITKVWNGAKDERRYYRNTTNKDMRK